jgi:hypothetical protein
LRLRQEIRRLAGLAEIVGNRHRFRSRNKMNSDGADRRGGNGILGKAKESSTGGSVRHLLLLLLCSLPHGLKRVERPRDPQWRRAQTFDVGPSVVDCHAILFLAGGMIGTLGW